MSTYITDFDDEDSDRWLKVEIDYDYEEPYHDDLDGGRLVYRLPGYIEVHSVKVLEVDYYNPDGELITNIKRPDNDQYVETVGLLVTKNKFDDLDREVTEIVKEMLEDEGWLAEELAEAA